MIKLENIVIKSDFAQCDIFPEDSVEKGTVKMSLIDNKIVSAFLPKGYEWCKMHLEHVKEYLYELYKSNTEVPNEKIIMWY